MLRTHNPISLQIPPLHYAIVCFLLAAVLFSLAAGAYFWNEAVHYLIYLTLGAVFAILGLGPLVIHLVHGRSR